MTSYLVTHIRRDRGDPDRRIDALAGPQFKDTIDNIIACIEGGHTFYVVGDGGLLNMVFLEVKTPLPPRRKFLQTVPDGKFDNNLYALPEIP